MGDKPLNIGEQLSVIAVTIPVSPDFMAPPITIVAATIKTILKGTPLCAKSATFTKGLPSRYNIATTQINKPTQPTVPSCPFKIFVKTHSFGNILGRYNTTKRIIVNNEAIFCSRV